MGVDIADQIARAKAGDTVALGKLLDSYRAYLRLLAQVQIGRRLQGKVDASDVVQEAFLDANRYFANFRGEVEAQLVGWLREILAGTMANTVRRYMGTRARDVRLEIGLAADIDQSSQALAHIPVDRRGSPSQHAIHGEQIRMVADALARLPEDYRQVILLRHMEGLPFNDIAQRMGKTVASVEKLWMRGLKSLRKECGEAP